MNSGTGSRRLRGSKKRYLDYIPMQEYRLDMKLNELREIAHRNPTTEPRFILPGGDEIPVHAHVTEVGHLMRNFIDCGGIIGREENVVLQTHVGDDTDHRLRADRFAKILALGNRVVPHDKLDVEVEYDCCVVAQYRVIDARPKGDRLDIQLGRKATQCRARERRKSESDACCASASTCC